MYLFELSVFVFAAVVVGYAIYKIKQANTRVNTVLKESEMNMRRMEAAHIRETNRRIRDEAEKERQALRIAFPVEKNVVPTTAQIRSFSKPVSGFTQPNRPTSGSIARSYTSSPSSTVIDNSGNDLLTAMILQNAMNSHHDVTSGTVDWNDNVPKVHFSNTSNPIDFPAPEPERSSYSPSYSSPVSPSSDDSSSRSSYSSSYSSSSSDSYSSSDSGSSSSSSSD